jgi:hypothetical protein
VEQPSPPGPRGPSRKHRAHWKDPAEISYRDHTVETDTDPDKPSVTLSRKGGRVVLEYDFARLGKDDAPERMVVTVNQQQGREERRRIPPQTYTFAIEHTSRGNLHIEAGLDPDRDYEVSVRLITAAGKPSGACQEVLERSAEAAQGGHPWDRLMRRVRDVFSRR